MIAGIRRSSRRYSNVLCFKKSYCVKEVFVIFHVRLKFFDIFCLLFQVNYLIKLNIPVTPEILHV